MATQLFLKNGKSRLEGNIVINKMEYLNKHLIIELYGCETDRINDVSYVEKIMKEAVEKANAKLINTTFQNFGKVGVVGIVIMEGGYYTIHTDSTYEYVGIDLHSYDDESIDNKKALVFLVRKFGAEKYSASEIKRGKKLEITK